MADELLRDKRGDVLWLTLNRPRVHNALNIALTDALTGAFADADGDAALRAVVLTGAGEASFCCGADLKESAAGVFAAEDGANPIAGVMRAIETCPRPVIARVNGAALAGGMGLVAACDLAYGAAHARFGLPELRVGLFPMMVAARLTRQIAPRRLQEMAYLGETIGADEAEAFGLINRCVAAEDLDRHLDAVLVRLRGNAPMATGAGKQALRRMRDMTPGEALAFAEQEIAALAQADEAREGRAAFAQKRLPGWTGNAV